LGAQGDKFKDFFEDPNKLLQMILAAESSRAGGGGGGAGGPGHGSGGQGPGFGLGGGGMGGSGTGAGAQAPAGPERAVAQARVCGNPAEAVAVRAAGDWEPAASELALAVAAQAPAEEQAVPGLEAAGDWEPVAPERLLG